MNRVSTQQRLDKGLSRPSGPSKSALTFQRSNGVRTSSLIPILFLLFVAA